MGISRYMARAELRHRRASLVVIALSGLLVTLVVVTALSGSRRTDSSLDRMRARTRAADATVQVDDLDAIPAAFEAVAALPIVETVAAWQLFPTLPDEGSEDEADFAVVAGLTDAFGAEVDRPRVLHGRLPRPGAPSEVALNELAARQLGAGIGDTVGVTTFSVEDLDILFGSGFERFPGFNGPDISLEVTGIVRWVDDLQGDVRQSNPVGLASPAFPEAHPDLGGFPPVLQVRLIDGASAADLRAEVRALMGADAELSVAGWESTYGSSLRDSIRVLTTTLLVIAAVAAIAGLVVTGQAVVRHLGSSREGAARLRELGHPRRAVAGAVAAGPAGALVAGVVAGAAASVLTSPLLPVGVARRAEPDPGLAWDLTAIAAGAIAIASLGLLVIAFRAWRVAAPGAMTDVGARATTVAELAAQVGAGPAAVNGVRLAYGAGRGSEPVPARAVIAGIALAVTGIVATSSVVISTSALAAEPERYGWTWSSKPDFEAEEPLDVEALQADERIQAVAVLRNVSVEIDDLDLRGYAVDSLRGVIALSLRDGRAPAADDEIALGARTLRALDAGIGDAVEATAAGGTGTVSLEVVGEVLLPTEDNAEPANGALLTPDGLESVARSEGFSSILLRYPDGVDLARLEAELLDDHPLGFSLYSRPAPPGSVQNLADARSMISALGIFFAALGTLALLHALLVATRRHANDVAMLRTMGFVRRQVHALMRWHAAAVVLSGTLIGVPAGLIVGRAAWRLVVGDLGLIDRPTDPWLAMTAVAPAALALALLLAALPARRMAGEPPAITLATE